MASLRISVLFLGILSAGISGCGKTGPLYLPAEPAPAAAQLDTPASPADSSNNNN
jgi:predicted small lipoprotein YifL